LFLGIQFASLELKSLALLKDEYGLTLHPHNFREITKDLLQICVVMLKHKKWQKYY
jgi:uncharacterized protein (DUF697 family)